ncbi:MAG: aldehyde dehydrogenase EutE, partial [Pseudomonadota bacterium]
MTMTDASVIQDVVAEVLNRLGSGASVMTAGGSNGVATGLFEAVDPAVEQATRSQRQLIAAGIETRRGICALIRQMAKDNAEAWGKFELDETRVGRLDHKIA